MKGYFKRLKSHPGLSTATLITLLGSLAGVSNKSIPPLTGLIFGTVVAGVLSWSCVLISNFKRTE